jgi:hypothetical protein
MHAMKREKIAVCGLTLLLLLCGFSAPVAAQKPAPTATPKAAQGSISGRITIAGEAAANVPVALVRVGRWEDNAVSRATTDGAGYYQLPRVPAGSYGVTPLAPAHIAPRDLTFGLPGKPVTIADGEHLTDIDIALEPGGVITGRVTDADDNPVIGERITLKRTGANQESQHLDFYATDMQTDDRGIYRIFGLTAGRYVVSVGHDAGSGNLRTGGGNGYYARTFHTEARDETKATQVEVRGGEEATGIDIKLGRAAQTFTALGRIVDKETGKPVAGVDYAYGTIEAEGKRIGSYAYSGSRTNARGEFRLTGLAPDRYSVFLRPEAEGDQYSEPMSFEIKDVDVSGLEVKVTRGLSINGVAVIESAKPAVRARLAEIGVVAFPVEHSEMQGMRYARQRLAAGGVFRLAGLRPGKYQLSFSNGYSSLEGFSILRVERDGVRQPNKLIDVGEGEHVTGVRLVFGYGNSSVRGQVIVTGGELPAGTRFYIGVRSTETESGGGSRGTDQVDGNRRFLIEKIPAGEYDVTLYRNTKPNEAPRIQAGKQRITVAEDSETQVTLTLDLTVPPTEGAP